MSFPSKIDQSPSQIICFVCSLFVLPNNSWSCIAEVRLLLLHRTTPMRLAAPLGTRAWNSPPPLNTTLLSPPNRTFLELLFKFVFNILLPSWRWRHSVQGQRFFIPPTSPLSFPITGLGPPVLSGSKYLSFSSYKNKGIRLKILFYNLVEIEF